MSEITILHLSDIHFKRSEKEPDPTFRGDVMEKMMAALRQHRDKYKMEPGFIAVTGDIAYSGRENEYAEARLFFNELKALFPGSEFLPVPGNHDVDREQVDPDFPLYETIIQKERIDSFLNNEKHIRGFIEPKFEKFKAFVKEINPGLYASPVDGISSPLTEAAGYFWVKNIECKKISFLGLNSGWTSGADNEAMKIALGYPQVMKALGFAGRENNKILLMHHPLFDWLEENDNSRCRGEIFNRCDLVLHGHKHTDEQLVLKSPFGSCISLGANASYTKEKDGFIGFQWIEVRFLDREVPGVHPQEGHSAPNYPKSSHHSSFITHHSESGTGVGVKVWPYRLELRAPLRFVPDTHRWEGQEGDYFGLDTFKEEERDAEKREAGKNGKPAKPRGLLRIPGDYVEWVRQFHSTMDIDLLAKKGEAVTVSLPEVYIPIETRNPFYKPMQEGKEEGRPSGSKKIPARQRDQRDQRDRHEEP